MSIQCFTDVLTLRHLLQQLTFRTEVSWAWPGDDFESATDLCNSLRSNGVFTLPNSNSCTDSYTDSYTNSYTDSDGNGPCNNVQNSLHWIYTDPYSNLYSDSNGYCTQFGTNKVKFNSVSLWHCISIIISIGTSVAFLHIIGIGVGIDVWIGVGKWKHTIRSRVRGSIPNLTQSFTKTNFLIQKWK